MRGVVDFDFSRGIRIVYGLPPGPNRGLLGSSPKDKDVRTTSGRKTKKTRWSSCAPAPTIPRLDTPELWR